MTAAAGEKAAGGLRAKALAFYLPQFHPIPENDRWWGPGFTEWRNVAKARPLYPGHYQPHVPGELGYYDLRVPEVRQAQAELARSHGISGFVYYHYWFHGRQLLNRPFDEVLESGEPDFPFALCWANEPWRRNWDGLSGPVLMAQEYSPQDDLEHFRWLARAFTDPRYLTIDGRPLLLVYRPALLPNARQTTDRWRNEAQRLGLPEPFLCWVESFERPPGGPEAHGFDATVAFRPQASHRIHQPVPSARSHRIVDYVASYERHLGIPQPGWTHFPSVMAGWDNTARRSQEALVFDGASPDAYRDWLAKTVARVGGVAEDRRLVFVLSWNEWAEGNHLEPDLHDGRGYLEATRAVLVGDPSTVPTPDGTDHPTEHGRSGVEDAVTHVLGELGVGPAQPIVRLRPADLEDGDVSTILTKRSTGEDRPSPAALVLRELDAAPEPQVLLAELSSWCADHGSPPLVVEAHNVAHVDSALAALTGRWVDPRPTHRQFTAAVLERLVTSSGWTVAVRHGVETTRTGRVDESWLADVPAELLAAIRLLAQTSSPHWATDRFVWGLTPTTVVAGALQGYAETIADAGRTPPGGLEGAAQRQALDRYLTSVGLVATEANRKALTLRDGPGTSVRQLRRLADRFRAAAARTRERLR